MNFVGITAGSMWIKLGYICCISQIHQSIVLLVLLVESQVCLSFHRILSEKLCIEWAIEQELPMPTEDTDFKLDILY